LKEWSERHYRRENRQIVRHDHVAGITQSARKYDLAGEFVGTDQISQMKDFSRRASAPFRDTCRRKD
jgi:hypothetical protein